MKFAVLDFETTGTSPEQDEIIQAGLALIDETGAVGSVYASFVRPTRPIPAAITQMTGITDEDVREAPAPEDMLAELVPHLADAVLVAHNASFDLQFLQAALDRSGYLPFAGRVIDTVALSRLVFPTLPSYRLGALTHSLGIPHAQAHRADSDAEATAALFVRCLEKLRSLPLLTLQRLEALLASEADDLGWLIARTAAWRAEQPPIIGAIDEEHEYYRQFALRVQDWLDEDGEQPPDDGRTPGQALADLTFDDFLASVQEQMRERLPTYETREGQRIMFREVWEALQSDSHLLVEAGTGTGKSLGYLLPSLYYGLKEAKKIVVSTHTIQLQEQLRQRDLPLLQEVLPVAFKAAVFKGRSNYLCLRKFEHQTSVPGHALSREEAVTRGQLVVWLSETETGEAEELNLSGRTRDEWDLVASDSDSCLNRQCPWFRKCFYHRARHAAGQADLVITNHALVFTDMRAEHRLLPVYDRLIVDEAHHLEEVASNHLGHKTGYHALATPLQRLWKDARTGLIPQLIFRLGSTGHERAQAWTEQLEQSFAGAGAVREAWDSWMERAYGLLAGHSATDESGNFTLRLRREALPDGWDAAHVDGSNVVLRLSDLIRPLEKLLAELREAADEPALLGLLTDLNGLLRSLAEVRENVRSFLGMEDPAFVYWLEGHAQFKARSVWMYAVPADVSELLKNGMFDRKASVVMTSATLTVDKSFQYVTEQLGLEQAREEGKLKTAQLPSPFRYREQALVLIPRDFPNIRGRDGDPQFLRALTQSIRDVALATGGRMLVLFTSHRMLRSVYAPLKELLEPEGIQVLGQGLDGGSRSRLTRQFREQPASVLLGTSSFWEGIDLPGDALTCLAIVRLPFQPPNHPVAEAKAERLQAEKKNPFMKLSLPQAVIKFKQGFGRLVRTASDKGIVIVYDTRVIDAYYGKYFLYSLPGPKMEHLPSAGLIPRIREWLAERPEAPEEPGAVAGERSATS